jgi:hypothetical protein
MPTPVTFWLNALDNSLNVAQATISSFSTSDSHTSLKAAICKLDVDASSCRSVFQFATNAADLTDVSAEDMYFFVDASGFKNLPSSNKGYTANLQSGTQEKELYKNIGNAYVHDVAHSANNYAKNTTGDDYTPDNKGLIKDLFRDLAHQMFNTQYGVDLFNNETDLCNNVFNNTSALFDDSTGVNNSGTAGAIWTVLNEANEKSVGWNHADKKLNIGRVLFEAIVAGDKDRLQDISNDEFASTASFQPAANSPGAGLNNTPGNDIQMRKYKMPLKTGDTLTFYLRYKYHASQKSIVGDSVDYDDRLYQVQLKLV